MRREGLSKHNDEGLRLGWGEDKGGRKEGKQRRTGKNNEECQSDGKERNDSRGVVVYVSMRFKVVNGLHEVRKGWLKSENMAGEGFDNMEEGEGEQQE